MPLTSFSKTGESSSKESLQKKDQGPNDSFKKRIKGYLFHNSRIPLKERLFFLQYFAIMIRAGIPISDILKTLTRQTSHKRFKMIIKDVEQKVEKGNSLADSFKPYENIFGELFINMIGAGEASGNLEGVLYQLYYHTKKRSALTSKVKNALTYPAFIVFVMIVVGILMMVQVVPELTAMLREFNTELPLPTKILIWLSDLVLTYGLFLGTVVVILILGAIQFYRTEKGKYRFQSFFLRIPIMKTIIKKINLARFARTMSSLLKSDIMITGSFKITADVLNNLLYREAVKDMGSKVERGEQINKIISKYPHLFPPVVHEVVSVGEKTGALDEMLLELAEHYEEEVSNTMDNLPSIIEPILIVLLGIAVGGLAVAIILPMYSLTTTI